MHDIQAKAQRRFIPITRWGDYHAWPPVGGLRHLVFHSAENGFGKCVVRAGRRVLIDEDEFLKWLETLKGVNK